MGNCLRKKTPLPEDLKSESVEVKKENSFDIKEVFEGVSELKALKIKGSMLLSESIGKPSENYEPFETIANLPCGIIKKVKHKFTNKTRSMKIVKKDLIEEKEDENIIFRELALLRSLNHPGILKLYEFYRDEKFFYFINDYCGYGDLFDTIKKNPKGFNEYTACHIMKQLLHVVAYCHKNKICNRDLRPENILIHNVEKRKVDDNEIDLYDIRVINFKSARGYQKNKKMNKKVGNPFYIAPEVLHRKYNEKCDIWSCGVIMYILLTGKPPFSGNTDKDILAKVEKGEVFTYFDTDLTFVSYEAKSLLKLMLCYDMDKRVSAVDALKQLWFKKYYLGNPIDQDFIFNSLKNLINFHTENKFALTTYAFMVHHLTDNDILQNHYALFSKFDLDFDGYLSYQDIYKGFQASLGNIIENEKNFYKLLTKVDQEKAGEISYEEFVRAILDKKALVTEKNIDATFKMFDKDGSGSIEPGEVKTILGLSANYTDKVWKEILGQIEHVDENEITYPEFRKMMINFVNNCC